MVDENGVDSVAEGFERLSHNILEGLTGHYGHVESNVSEALLSIAGAIRELAEAVNSLSVR